MKAGFVQTSPRFGDKESNFREIDELVAGNRFDLLVLPELFATGYTFVSRDEALALGETEHGRTAEYVTGLAARIGGTVVAGYAERSGDRLYNAAMLATERGPVGTYRKIHLFNREKLWFDPGDRPFEAYDVGVARVGMMICFDWFFPEAARSLALLGADVIAHPSNLVLPYCQTAMVTRCLENRVFSITANRTGREQRGEDDFTFTGSSRIVGPRGEVLLDAAHDVTTCAGVELDPALARDKRLNDHNVLLEERRAKLYVS